MDGSQLLALQDAAAQVYASPALVDYVLALVQATRSHGGLAAGLSPRAGLALLACARAWALLAQRDLVLPEDVQAVFTAVAGHRLLPAGAGGHAAVAAELAALQAGVAIP
jgi:MoxR-like ATPase